MSKWLALDEAVAFLRAQGFDDAADLLSDAADRGQIRCQRRPAEVIRAEVALYSGIRIAGTEYTPGPGEIDSVLATDVRAYARGLKSGKPYWPELQERISLKRIPKPSELEAAFRRIKELRAAGTTNAAEEAELRKLLGYDLPARTLNELRRKAGLKSSGRKSS